MTPDQRIRIMIVILGLILVACIYFTTNMNEELQGTRVSHQGPDTKKYDCVISINVHERFDFLMKQLQNIKENVHCKYCIVLNCNQEMYDLCQKNIDELATHVHAHDIAFNKQTHHGSLTRGIYTNMVYMLQSVDFEYFIVASSRSMFTNQLSLGDLHSMKLVIDKEHVNRIDTNVDDVYKTYETWHWPNFFGTLLAKKYIANKTPLYSSPHEGLCFTRKGCEQIVGFLEGHADIRDNLFQHDGCVEEFSLQSIAMAQGESFFYIGNGCCTDGIIGPNAPHSELKRFMYKMPRV